MFLRLYGLIIISKIKMQVVNSIISNITADDEKLYFLEIFSKIQSKISVKSST